jgi:hypothetical protein
MLSLSFLYLWLFVLLNHSGHATLKRSFVVSTDAVSVDVSPKCSKRLPPTVIRTLFDSASSGQIATTLLA